MGFLPAALLLLLAIGFDPFWIDFEVARRGLLLMCAAAVLLTNTVRRLPRPTTAAWMLLALVSWHWICGLRATDGWASLDRNLHLTALAVLFLLGTRSKLEDWLAAALPVGMAVSAFGLAQNFGIWWPTGYGSPRDPVSTLGNLNVAAELVAICGAAAAAMISKRQRTPAAMATLALCVAYLMINQSRSGLLALPIACIAALAQPGQGARPRAKIMIAALAGIACGLLAQLGQADSPEPVTPEASVSERSVAPSTIAVRYEVWKGCLSMASAAPLMGHGAGQFRVEYPNHRTPEEIELSSFGRHFATHVDTAHNDHLEILTETGWPGLILWWGFLLAIVAGHLRKNPAALAPLLAFALLSLVRSPLGNAPAAAFIFALAGTLAVSRPARNMPGWTVGGTLPLAGFMFWLGLSTIGSQCAASGYQKNRALPEQGFDPLPCLDRGIEWAPHDPQLRALRAQERTGQASWQDLQEVLARRPHDTSYLLLAATAAMSQDRKREAIELVGHVLELDPLHPGGILLHTTLHIENGPQFVLPLLYEHPHPRLREQLAKHLNRLAKIEQHESHRAVYRFEAAFIATLDALLEQRLVEANEAVTAFAQLREDHPDMKGDPRPRILSAAQFLALDKPKQAEQLAPEQPISLNRLDRALMEPVIEPLLKIPAWSEALR